MKFMKERSKYQFRIFPRAIHRHLQYQTCTSHPTQSSLSIHIAIYLPLSLILSTHLLCLFGASKRDRLKNHSHIPKAYLASASVRPMRVGFLSGVQSKLTRASERVCIPTLVTRTHAREIYYWLHRSYRRSFRRRCKRDL